MAVVAMLLPACRPKGVPSPKEIENLLVDLHFTDGVLAETGLNYGHEEELRGYYAAILAKHGMTQEQFDTALVWYTAHSVQFEKIYPRVHQRLEKRLEAMNRASEQTETPVVKSPEEWREASLHPVRISWPEQRKAYKVSPILQLEK